MTSETGFFQCNVCQTVYPLSIDKTVTGVCGECLVNKQELLTCPECRNPVVSVEPFSSTGAVFNCRNCDWYLTVEEDLQEKETDLKNKWMLLNNEEQNTR